MDMDDNQIEQVSRINYRLWVRIIPFLHPYRTIMILTCICLALLGVMDVLMTYLTKYIIDRFILTGDVTGKTAFFIFYGVYTMALAFVIYLFIHFAGIMEAGLACDIREAGFAQLQNLSRRYYDQHPAGRIMARLTSDVVKLGEFISWGLVDMVWGFTMMIGIIVIMIVVNLRLAVITLSVVPALVFVSWYFQQHIMALQRHVRGLNARITGAIHEGITGARTTKTLVVEDSIIDAFSGLTGEMRQKSIRSAMFSALFQPVVINIGAVGTVLALTAGGYQVTTGMLSYGTIVLFVNYSMQFFEPIREMARILSEMQSAQVSAERILHLLDERPDIQDREDVIQVYGTILHPRKEIFSIATGNIVLDQIEFFYHPAEPVFECLSLTIEAGTSVALVGSTGSGKSSLVNLICRFYDPIKGRILMDGMDIRDRSQSWLHHQIGYMQQTPHLFSGSVMDNIRYGNLLATDDEIKAAAIQVGVHDFIEKLANGYHTQVGEGGGLLSAGQRQIISFARAVIRQPPIFILDEATSSIDTQSERLIQDALQIVLAGRTSIIIAHRLSTIRSCDRILLMEGGNIIEDGSHEQLMTQRGHYWKLYTNQYIAESEHQLLKEKG
jgi:ATP-binding cassette subfamily B protein